MVMHELPSTNTNQPTEASGPPVAVLTESLPTIEPPYQPLHVDIFISPILAKNNKNVKKPKKKEHYPIPVRKKSGYPPVLEINHTKTNPTIYPPIGSVKSGGNGVTKPN